MNANCLRLDAVDDVAVALENLCPGDSLAGNLGLVVLESIPKGHKVALRARGAGEVVRKYGQPIGIATQDIQPGSHVHVHNLAYSDSAARPETGPSGTPRPLASEPLSFEGFHRPGGNVGTRNYIAVITSVNCSATVGRRIAAYFHEERLAEYPNVDGVIALCHGSGCGLPADGTGFELLVRCLRGYAEHPNVGGVLMLGLGCEVNQVGPLADDLAPARTARMMTIQDAGGTSAAIRAGIEEVEALLELANGDQRAPAPASELLLGLNCGGSDGYSGLTANPALGKAVDLLVAHGGGAVLGETTEIFGAEHLLLRRAVSPEVAHRLLERLEWWRDYVRDNGATVDNNPSPGNKAGGLTTIAEKSLGAVAKAGSSPLCAVYGYAERISERGLVFMDTPGYDPVSVTGIVAGGANLVCFTTGRGSVFGCKPVPTLKLCSNSETFRRMEDDVDIDCGRILGGGASVDSVGREIFDELLAVASGKPTKSELLGFGDEEFAPWQLGAVV